jgi:hypothetical protein
MMAAKDTIRHERGVLYDHVKRPQWGAALYLGEAEGKRSFSFADGEVRTFAAERCDLLVPAQGETTPLDRTPVRRAARAARSASPGRA